LTDEFKCKEVCPLINRSHLQITDKLQENFLARFPPSQRQGPFPQPVLNRDSAVDALASDKVELDASDVKRYGKRKAGKIAKGQLAYEDGIAYDMSLAKAIYLTSRKRFVIAALFSVASGKSLWLGCLEADTQTPCELQRRY
jgi:hypothetical protein